MQRSKSTTVRPHFRRAKPRPSCRKLLIAELKEEKGAFYLSGKRIVFVEILGTVISLQIKEKHSIMLVDDNTAIIQCITFHDKPTSVKEAEKRKRKEEDSDEEEDFKAFARRIVKREEPLKLGDLVNVTGRINLFSGRWQIITTSVGHVKCSNAEWFRVREIEAHRKALKK